MTPGDAVEHHLEVTKTARYLTLGDVAGAQDVWIVLHGYKQLARRFLRRFQPIAEPGRLVVAPEALSRFYTSAEPGRHGPSSVVGASWMTREDRLHEIRDYVAYLDQVARAVLPLDARVTVLGFSQGTATAARWVTMGSVKVDRLILWAGYLPHDQDLERGARIFSDTELILVRGDEDPGLADELAERERDQLESAHIPHRIVRYEGGHEIEPEALLQLVADRGSPA
jgi:predicted esterase